MRGTRFSAVALTGTAWMVATAGAQATPGAEPAAVTVTGTVVDSTTGEPLAGAYIQMVLESRPTQGRTATADSLGAFAFPAVPPGRYVVGFIHPALDALRIEPPARVVDVAEGAPARVALATPSPTRTGITRG